ncbi:enhancer of mRNA decapping [Apophysomyces sp. BC1021]|nr:enhancer of mRNA decapping [Apophysomyces sp. BC1021]
MNLSEEQLIENGGRGACMLALQAIGGAQRLQSGKVPTVIVLVGNNNVGAFGLSAARHLANHGCHIIVCVAGSGTAPCNMVTDQMSMSIKLEAELNHHPAELVIDAMLGSQEKLVDLQEEQATYRSLCDMIGWANGQTASILSIDFPSGVDGGTGMKRDFDVEGKLSLLAGEPHNTVPFIRPQWTLCMGAPKSGCLSTEVTGELYMTDLGIPRLCWKKVGVKGWTMPWGADFLIALEYVS